MINRGDSDLTVSLTGVGLNHGNAMRLLAPSVKSTTEVTFAGAPVDNAGHWIPAHVDKVNAAEISLPKMSAVVLVT